MATTVVNTVLHNRNRIHLPAKMAGRNVEVMAVGAWVQPESVHEHRIHEAVESAKIEATNIKRQQEEKEARLQQFQEDVKRRVQTMEKIKRQQILEKSFRAVELERNVVRQSSFAAEKSTPRKNRCSVRDMSILSIKQSGILTDSHGCITSDSGVDKSKTFLDQMNQVRMHNKLARRQLSSHRVLTEYYNKDDLPGGLWKVGSTLDHPASRNMTDNDMIDLTNNEVEDAIQLQTQPKTVHFSLEPDQEETRKQRIARKSASPLLGTQIERVPSVPNIYPGVQSEEEKQQAISQRAMYRRLFMDIEREQVKENIRKKVHRKRIQQLKKDKEAERRCIEEAAEEEVMPKDLVTGETQSEALKREILEEACAQRSVEEQRRRQQKHVETERFYNALKCSVQEKVEQSGVDLPPMCCCGPTVWDTNPETCANNCIFYRNPKAYAKALQSLLVSCTEVN